MRVLTLIHLYPPHHLGGYEIACRGTMERFVDLGDDVLVLTSDYRFGELKEVQSDVDVRRELRGWFDMDAFVPASFGLGERLRRERHNQKTFLRILTEFRPDVVSIWDLAFLSWTLPTLAEERHLPIVLTFLDQWVTTCPAFDMWTRMFERIPGSRMLGRMLGLETRLPAFDDALATIASKMIGETIARDSRWKFPEAELISLGVDTADFPVSMPEEKEWQWRVLYVGRVVRQKGVFTLVEALPLLPNDVRLEFDGHVHDLQRGDLLSTAEHLGVAERVSFHHSQSRPELRNRYQAADVLVFPSEWAEPFGIVLLEAMASGVPVVATGTGGSGEFVEDGVNCVLFTPGDPQSLASALHRVAEDAELRHRIVQGGLATARTLTMDNFAEELHELHRKALRT